MKRIWLSLFIFVFALPTLAQSDDLAIYEFETGTTLSYPEGWETELVDGVLSIANGQESQILVFDYPLVRTLSEDEEPLTNVEAVQALLEILIDFEINANEVYEFKLGVRNVAAYDFEVGIPSSVFAVEFTNGAMGMLATINVEEDLALEMVESFDNSEEAVSSVPISGRSGVPRDTPSIYLLETDQRFLIPAGWTTNIRQNDTIQYAVLTVPGEDVFVQLIDLSQTVTKGTALEDVIDSVDVDWEGDFGFEIGTESNPYEFSDRESISYDVEVDGVEGILVVLRFSDDAIGLAVMYGDDSDQFQLQIEQLVGSFNNLGAILNFIN